MIYEQIFFAQGSEAVDLLSQIKNEGPKPVLAELKHRHNPGEHETRDKPSHGRKDYTFSKNCYTLSFNFAVGTVGLEYAHSEARYDHEVKQTLSRWK